MTELITLLEQFPEVIRQAPAIAGLMFGIVVLAYLLMRCLNGKEVE